MALSMIGGNFRKEKIAVEWTEQFRYPVKHLASPATGYRPVPEPARYPGYAKRDTVWWPVPRAVIFKPVGKERPVLSHIIAADKAHQWMVRGHYCMYRQFRLLALGVADGFIMRMGRVYWTTVEDNPIHSALMQSAIKLLFSVAFSEKFRMTDFDAVGKHLWQGIEKMPERREIAWAKGGGQLQPVLTDAAFQRRHSGQNSCSRSSQLRRAA